MSVLTHTLRSLFQNLPDYLTYLPDFLWKLAVDVVIPLVIGLLAFSGGLKLLLVCIRILFPPDANTLHKEALGILKKADNEASRTEAKLLLEKAIKRDPMYLGAHQSLAAIQLYYDDEKYVEASIITIERALKLFPKNRDLHQMRLDAKATQQNLGHMVRAGNFIGSKHVGAIGLRIR